MSKTSEDKNKNWKKKAIERSLDIKKKEKRIKELVESRDSWKKKYLELKNNGLIVFNEEKAHGHQYPVQLVWLMVLWQEYGGMSLRGVRHCIAQLYVVLNLNCKVPSHVSIRNWTCKMGYFRLQEVQKRSFDGEEWVLIIDESIGIGSQKMLLILGLPISKWDFSRSLTQQDVEVMCVDIFTEWKAEQISEKLACLKENYCINQVICDNGNNLKKALNLSKLSHIPDCSHVIANALAHQYQKNEDFVVFSKRVGSLRKKWLLGKKSIYNPPIQRTKARFQNIFPIIEWAKNILSMWEKLPSEIRGELTFVEEQKELIEELFLQIDIMNSIAKILKINGLNTETALKVEVLLALLTTEKGLKIKQEILDYLKKLVVYFENGQTILCCSDIIESYFGKFKTKINTKMPNQMTEFVLTIANFGTPIQQQEIKQALETIKCEDLKKWKQNSPILTLKKQQKMSKNGTKKAA